MRPLLSYSLGRISFSTKAPPCPFSLSQKSTEGQLCMFGELITEFRLHVRNLAVYLVPSAPLTALL